MDWNKNFEPRAGGLTRLRAELDQTLREERLERFFIGGLTAAMVLVIVVFLNVDLFKPKTELTSTAGQPVELPRAESSNVRIVWMMN